MGVAVQKLPAYQQIKASKGFPRALPVNLFGWVRKRGQLGALTGRADCPADSWRRPVSAQVFVPSGTMALSPLLWALWHSFTLLSHKLTVPLLSVSTWKLPAAAAAPRCSGISVRVGQCELSTHTLKLPHQTLLRLRSTLPRGADHDTNPSPQSKDTPA